MNYARSGPQEECQKETKRSFGLRSDATMHLAMQEGDPCQYPAMARCLNNILKISLKHNVSSGFVANLHLKGQIFQGDGNLSWASEKS